MSIIETDPSLALQAAQFAALDGDADLLAIAAAWKIYDRVPDGAAFPFGTVGDDLVSPTDTVCGSSTEIVSTVRAYSRAVGKVEAKRLAARIRFMLTKEAGLTVPGFRMLAGHCEGYRIIQHTDGLTHHAEMNFRYRLNPVAP
jgi:hypothetical protein